MTDLLERDQQLEHIASLLQAARIGEGSLLLITGEAGAGKTSLVRRAARDAAQDAIVLEGACDPLTTPRPLGPLLDFATSGESGLSELRTAATPPEMFGVILNYVQKRLRPVLMIIEDAHWADDGTLDFLRFIGRRVASTNAVIVCTFRDDEVGHGHPLRTVLGQLAPLDSTHRMTVPPLSERAVEELSTGHDVDASHLYAVTGGNPFFVTEVLASGEAIPQSVQDAVLARVADLTPAARRAVEVVSISPRSLETRHVRLLTEAEPRDVEEATASGVVVHDETGLRFRHELARAAIEESLPVDQRHDLHSRMVELLSSEPVPDLARVAHHAVGSGSYSLILDHVPQAADEAAHRNAHRQAAAFYDAILAQGHRLDEQRLVEFRARAAGELRLLGRAGEALEHYIAAEQFYGSTGDIGLLAQTLLDKAGAQWSLSQTTAARETVGRTISLLAPAGPSELLGRAYVLEAHFWMLARRYQPGMTAATEALHIAKTIAADDLAEAARLRIAWIELLAGDTESGAEAVRLLIEQPGAAPRRFPVGSSPGVSMMWANLGSGSGEVRRYDTAHRALQEGIELGLRIDEDASVAYQRAWLARIAFETGDYHHAIELANLADATAPNRVGTAVVTARGALGRTMVRLGEEGGRQLLEQTLALGEHHEVQHVWSLWSGVAEHAWLWGKAETIPTILEAIYQRALETDTAWGRGELSYWMWVGGGIQHAPANVAEPFALQMGGRWQEAADAWRQIGCPYEVALSLSAGDHAARLEALQIFDDLRARPAAARLRAGMRAEGVESIPRGPMRETRSNPANLTPRQLEVTELLTAGLTNAEIAEQLFVSKKTVEHHVSAVFLKLGVESRAEAAAAARRLLGEK